MSGRAAVEPLLAVEELRVRFATRSGTVEAVRGICFEVGRERLGIVGESGSGKTMTGRAILRLIRPPGQVEARRRATEGLIEELTRQVSAKLAEAQVPVIHVDGRIKRTLVGNPLLGRAVLHERDETVGEYASGQDGVHRHITGREFSGDRLSEG